MERVIEFDDDSGAKGEHVAQQHAAGSEAELDVEVEIHEAAVTAGGRRHGGWRRRWLRRYLCGGRGLHTRLQFGSKRGANLNFDGDGSTGIGFVPRLEADDGVRRPRGCGGGGEMELNFATDDGGEGCSGQAGDLSQEFFQGFLVFRSDVF